VRARAICHTLRDAGSQGAVVPIFDGPQPDADRDATALRNGPDNMPSHRATLSQERINALARYGIPVERPDEAIIEAVTIAPLDRGTPSWQV
jgi:mono/diheme cytochrome c family protein